jgi:hypothetical protein
MIPADSMILLRLELISISSAASCLCTFSKVYPAVCTSFMTIKLCVLILCKKNRKGNTIADNCIRYVIIPWLYFDIYWYPELYYLCLLIRTDNEANNVPSQSFPWLGILLLMHSCIHQGLSGTRMWIVTAGLSTQRKSKWDSDSQRSCQFFHFPTKNSSDPNIAARSSPQKNMVSPQQKEWFPPTKNRCSIPKNGMFPLKIIWLVVSTHLKNITVMALYQL